MPTENESETTPEVPSVIPQEKKKRGRPRKDQSASPTSSSAPPKKPKHPGIPISDGLIGATADLPFVLAGTAWKMKTGRTLEIPGAGSLEPKPIGPEQIRALYEESVKAWSEMAKSFDIRLSPGWMWLGSTGLTIGAVIGLDVMKMQVEHQAKVTGTGPKAVTQTQNGVTKDHVIDFPIPGQTEEPPAITVE